MSRDEIFRILAEYILRKAAQELVKQDEEVGDQQEELRELARDAIGALKEVLENLRNQVTTYDDAEVLADAAEAFQSTLGIGEARASVSIFRNEIEDIDYRGSLLSHYDVEENMKVAATNFIDEFEKDVSDVENEIDAADAERLREICKAVYETLEVLKDISVGFEDLVGDVWDELERVISEE